MSSKGFPGAMPGDQSVYAGRTLLGFIRPSAGGISVYAVDGQSLGTFTNPKAAMAALTAAASSGERAHDD